MSDIVIVITARFGSTRLPGKVLEPIVDGITAIHLQVKRASITGLPVVIAIPDEPGEEVLIDYARSLPGVAKVSVNPPGNLLREVYEAAKVFKPKAIIRGLQDCPYLDYQASKARAEALIQYGAAEATRSRHPFGKVPLYGTDEPAYSWNLIKRMMEEADEFERFHVGAFVDRNRLDVNILYTPPPALDKYVDAARPIRLEIDTKEDLTFVRKVMDKTGPMADARQAAYVALKNPAWVRINAHIQEKTGPVTSFREYQDEHNKSLAQAYELDPSGNYLFGLAQRFTPILCQNNECFVGYVDPEEPHKLIRPTGEEVIRGNVRCPCGAGRRFY